MHLGPTQALDPAAAPTMSDIWLQTAADEAHKAALGAGLVCTPAAMPANMMNKSCCMDSDLLVALQRLRLAYAIREPMTQVVC